MLTQHVEEEDYPSGKQNIKKTMGKAEKQTKK